MFSNKVNRMLSLTKCKVLNESEVMQTYGNNIGSSIPINHMLITDNTIIFIQSKLVNDDINPIKINNLLQSINTISSTFYLPLNIFAVYLSKQPITGSSRLELKSFNQTNNIQFKSFCNINEEIILNKLMSFLYTNKIFMYSEDGDAIMYDNTINHY